MLTIVSANENLLERLELLIQNTPKPESGGANGRPAQARTLLLGASTNGLPVQVPACRHDAGDQWWCTKWVVLMAKRGFDEHQCTLQTLADLLRLSLAMTGGTQKETGEDEQDNTSSDVMKILILKKERAEEDEECLRENMERVRREWSEEWGDGMAEKLRRFGESDARKEQLERSKRWMEQGGQQDGGGEGGNLARCAIAYFDDPNLMRTINTFFQFGNCGFEILDSNEDDGGDDKRHQLFTKPPALHWTNYPRESEVQVTFKFTFPKGTIPELLFRDWITKGKQLMVWDYEYEWTNGILLRADELIKITITRATSESNVVELSGRIDTDEAAEEEEQEREEERKRSRQEEQENGLECGGDDGTTTAAEMFPLQKVWPYLVRIFQKILADVENRKTLPFCLSLVFIGDLFFKCPEGSQKLNARSLDAIQTLSSIQRIKSVRFRVDQEQIYALNLDQCFPNFLPTKLADFAADKFPLPTPKLSIGTTSTSSSSPSEIPTAATSLGGSAIIVEPMAEATAAPKMTMEKMKVDRSPSCVPSFALAEENNNNGGRGRSATATARKEASSSSLSSSPQPGQSSLHVDRHMGAYKNRGRRVSFGVIHSIPSLGDGSGHSTPGLTSPSPLLMSISSNRFGDAASPEPDAGEQQNGDEKGEKEAEEGEEQKSSAMVENIVDEMLQKAIDEVLVTE